MRVILFQDQFAPLVEDGTKTQTIRKAARCKPGDVLSLRKWSGKPYRSKQDILQQATCTVVIPVEVGTGPHMDGIALTGIECDDNERAVIAKLDGFDSANEMLEWFKKVHSLPFTGEIIMWEKG